MRSRSRPTSVSTSSRSASRSASWSRSKSGSRMWRLRPRTIRPRRGTMTIATEVEALAGARRYNLQETLAHAIYQRFAAMRGVKALQGRDDQAGHLRRGPRSRGRNQIIQLIHFSFNRIPFVRLLRTLRLWNKIRCTVFERVIRKRACGRGHGDTTARYSTDWARVRTPGLYRFSQRLGEENCGLYVLRPKEADKRQPDAGNHCRCAHPLGARLCPRDGTWRTMRLERRWRIRRRSTSPKSRRRPREAAATRKDRPPPPPQIVAPPTRSGRTRPRRRSSRLRSRRRR